MISDELQECKSSFKGYKQPYQIDFYLESTGEKDCLVIELKNKLDAIFYRISIDRQYIKDKTDLSFCFQTPEELFYTLMQLFEQVIIENEGILILEMKLNATKLKRKVLKIQLQRCEVDDKQLLKLKLESLRKQFKNDSHSKSQKIKSLVTSNIQLSQTVEVLREELGEVKKDQQNLYLQNKRQQFKMNTIIKENQQQRQEIASLKKNLDYFLLKLNTLEIYSFFQNPHWHYFSVVKTQNSFRIIRKDSDAAWCSFVYNAPLKEGKTNGFMIRQTKTCYKNIMYGIGTNDIFGLSNSYKDKFSLTYNAYSGNIWEKESSRKSGSSIYDGQAIAMDVNLQNYTVSWSVDGKKMGEALISEQMRKKQIYLVMQFYNVEDEVELLLF